MDPRMDRTRRHVLACARELLADRGAAGVTFTTVARTARVSRNTLYRHWSTREQLLVDVTLMQYEEETRSRAPRGPEEFLHTVRDSLGSAGGAAALASLIARAGHDQVSADVLRQVAGLRQSILAEAVGPVSDAEFASLVGPLFYQALIARRPVDDAFLADLAHAFTERREGRS
ncbi:helix-turn-helix domain-containing protein [Streptomyces sp. NPDC049954]|uniref:helix-turn-helix domain-containing protein n=1 Tax=Streptomyces sp. NPDC049954 TaxID=3155779 RepID=UPI00342A150C